ncbi:MAG: prolyl oligopeptidase family serine peptidase [Amphritea sp.]
MAQQAYGFLPSIYTAEDAVGGSVEQGQLKSSDRGVFWVEFRPQEGGRSVICQYSDGEASVVMTPEGFSVRSKVHQYGGAAWCLLDLTGSSKKKHQLAFVNSDDQQIYLQSLDSSCKPQQLTTTADCCYADLIYDQRFDRLIAVQEQLSSDPTQPINRLVSINLGSGQVEILVSGDDFYASPILNASGDRFAWICWQHPHMPWVSTQLYSGVFNGEGELAKVVQLAGDTESESLQQPEFLPDNTLLCLSDRSGWWNLYRYLDEQGGTTKYDAKNAVKSATQIRAGESIWQQDAELGIAQWQLGVRTWGSLTSADGNCWLVGSWLENGRGYLEIKALQGQQCYRLDSQFSLFRYISCVGDRFYCIAASEDCSMAVIQVCPDFNGNCEVQVLAGGNRVEGLEYIARPEAISYPVADGEQGAIEQAYGFLYMPEPLDSDTLPPLLVFTHGGPTAATYAVFNPKIQFWIQRGFAVVDLNYRGSSSFGRVYRDRLHRQWGITDIKDCVAAVDYLTVTGRINGDKVFIRGGSAGGYTTLCALAFSNRFTGGASHYGVSDPLSLTRDTHKFESHYLDWLIGDPVADIDNYRARTPLLSADRINCPVIFFQGADDRVVLPDQTEKMVTALQQQGIRVEYHLFEGEQHGFRRSENQITALESELAFYQSLLSEQE